MTVTTARLTQPRLSAVMIDAQGRAPLARAARALRWAPGHQIEMVVVDNVLRLMEPGTGAAGPTATIDARGRIQVPYGLRELTGLSPGSGAIALTTINRLVALVPASTLVAALGSA